MVRSCDVLYIYNENVQMWVLKNNSSLLANSQDRFVPQAPALCLFLIDTNVILMFLRVCGWSYDQDGQHEYEDDSLRSTNNHTLAYSLLFS